MIKETEAPIQELSDLQESEVTPQNNFESNLLLSNMAFEIPKDSVEHAHHWVIEEPNGPISKGCCKGCGGSREFKNWPPEMEKFTLYEGIRGSMDF